MAIDSADKRRAAVRIGPIPDGSIDSELDRRQAIGLYRIASAIGPYNIFGSDVVSVAGNIIFNGAVISGYRECQRSY